MTNRINCDLSPEHVYHYKGSVRFEECIYKYASTKDYNDEQLLASERGTSRLKSLLDIPEEDINKPGFLGNIANVSDFVHAAAVSHISVSPHPDPEVPYVILNYTPAAMYSHAWNDVTINSRGLIINQNTGEIISRGFPKFFNYNQLSREEIANNLKGPVTVTDKMDGSLGILYKLPSGKYAVSTRGSMDSEMSHVATQIFQEKYAKDFKPKDGHTYMFEIIYPENRIVVDYGDKKDIVLLGAQDNATLESEDINETAKYWPGETTEIYPYKNLDEALEAPISDDKEGYVLYFHDTKERVKLKGETYLALHKTKFGLNRNSIVGSIISLKDPKDLKSWVASLPDEAYDDVNNFITEYNNVKTQLTKDAAKIANEAFKLPTVQEQHQFIRNSKGVNGLNLILWSSKMNNAPAEEVKTKIDNFFDRQLKTGGQLKDNLPDFKTFNIIKNPEEA